MAIYDNLPEVARMAINRMVAVTEKEKRLLHKAIDSAVDTSKAYSDSLPGGGISDIVEDLTPQLGGSLDVNGKSIVSAGGTDIAITPDTTGSIILDGVNWPQADGTINQVIETDGAGQLAWVAQSGGGLSNIVEDLTPELGGDLDVNSYRIVSTEGAELEIRSDGALLLNNFIWPAADGTAGYVLKTDGGFNLSWVAQTAAGIANIVEDLTPQLGGNLDTNGKSIVSAAAADITITPDTTGSIILDGLSWPQADGAADQVLKTDGAAQLSWVANAGSGIANVVDDVTPQLGGDLDVNGKVIVSAGAGNIAITPDTTGDIVLDGLKWPQADGTAGYVLKTDGAAQLSWVAQGGGGTFLGLSDTPGSFTASKWIAVNGAGNALEEVTAPVFTVAGTAPITSSGTTAITVGISASSGAAAGSMSAANFTKLSNIELSADKTDATNVAAAGAIMDSNYSADGFQVRLTSTTYTSRTIQAGLGISITNGDGQAANPTITADVQSVTGGNEVTVTGTNALTVAFDRTITASTSAPSGGAAGDIWYRYV